MGQTGLFLQILWLIGVDILFLCILGVLLIPFGIYRRAAFAVLKRNFVGYFSNPTGYVFLCLFVLLTSLAAFWPHEFFTNNLANLDQLNNFLPFIMLIFVPAITMSVWAEERRQGTDELLLTLPANDFDIVMGKFLAAGGVFTASLLFSQLSNFIVLVALSLGEVDTGLFFANYFGYWLIGLAMIAVGMVASFLTSNLTVSFVLGVLFNAPLAFAAKADLIIPMATMADLVRSWSISSQYEPFGRGVLSLSSLVYFIMIIGMGIYVCIVLIGRRHWLGGRDGDSLLVHYLVRVFALLVVAISISVVFANRVNFRPDLTRNKTASLSQVTRKIIRGLESDHPVMVHAFVSREVPKEYAEVKENLLSLLREFEAQGKIRVKMYTNIETFSQEARLAEERFEIRPEQVRFRSRGRLVDDEIILGTAFTAGLRNVVVPFFDYGVPVEYELVRSINTVAKQERKRLGVVRTEAQMMGGTSFAGGFRQLPKQAVIVELEKQYDVEEVDPMSPIDTSRFDVLLVVQPSSLSPEGMTNLIAGLKQGIPAAIFEDPVPYFMQNMPGTGQPKQAPGGMMGMGAQTLPKANIQDLWSLLGIRSPGKFGMPDPRQQQPPLFQPDVVWQRYNPYEKLQLDAFPDEWIFVRKSAPGGENAINSEEDITAELEEVLFPYAGSIISAVESDLDPPIKLLQTGKLAGTIAYEDLVQGAQDVNAVLANRVQSGQQVLAVRIKGTLSDEAMGDATDSSDDEEGESSDGRKSGQIDVVYVADTDVLGSPFFSIRARPDEMEDVQWRFENVTFVLNVIDELSGDDAYVSIRNHKPRHATLQLVEARIEEQRSREHDEQKKFRTEYKKNVDKANEKIDQAIREFEDQVNDLIKRQNEGEVVDQSQLRNLQQQLLIRQAAATRKKQLEEEREKKARDRNIRRIRRDADLEIQQLQTWYKVWAVVLPPIVPALIGICVLFSRLLREREGIEKSRLK